MSELKEYHSSFTGQEVDSLLTKVKDGSLTADIEKELSEKADKDGHYPEFTAGFADNLVGRGESIPAEFSFRASGGKSIEDGAARIKTLRGNAVVWNQLRQDRIIGDAYTYTNVIYSDGILNIGGATKNYATLQVAGDAVLTHYYYIGCNVVSNNFDIASICSNPQQMLVDALRLTSAGICQTIVKVNTEASIKTWRFTCADSSYVSKSAVLQGLKIIDLTQMFGAGNEPTTIEEYNARKPIVEDENSYNEGEVIPFTAEGIKSIGDNAWDGEWEQGDVSGSNGVEMDSTATWRNKGYIRIIPNEYYYILSDSKSFLRARFYDADKNFIGIVSANNTDIYTNEAFKTASNAHYMRFAPNKSAIAEGTQMCVSLVHSGYKEGKYFPYEQDIRKIDSRILEEFPNGMMPWDKVYNKSGKGYIVKGTGVVDMGDLIWAYSNNAGWGTGFYANLIAQKNNSAPIVLSDCYLGISADSIYGANVNADKIITIEDGRVIRVHDSAYTDVASFKAAMAGVPLYYELAEPTIIEYDEPFNLDYLVWDFGTEEIIADKPSAPLKADIIYQFNAVDEIRELRQLIATMQAQLASLTSNNNN